MTFVREKMVKQCEQTIELGSDDDADDEEEVDEEDDDDDEVIAISLGVRIMTAECGRLDDDEVDDEEESEVSFKLK